MWTEKIFNSLVQDSFQWRTIESQFVEKARKLQRSINFYLMQQDVQWIKTHKTSNHCVVMKKIKFFYSLPYVSLSDQHTSVMNTLRQTKLKYLSLKTPLQEIFDSQTQHVIELHSGLIEHANTYETTQKSIAFEQPSLIFLLQCKKFSRSLSDLRQSELHTPYLAFVTKPIVSNNF